MLSILRRKEIPIMLFIIGCIITLFAGFLNIPVLTDASGFLVENSAYIAIFPVYFGTFLTLRYHMNKLRQPKKTEDYFSVILLLFLVLMIVAYWSKGTFFDLLFNTLMQPISIAILSIVGFFTFSAMYRAFKARNLDALAFFISAVITMMSNAPLGLQIWPGFSNLRVWLDTVPNLAAMRSVLIVTFIGTMAIMIRSLLGYEKVAIGVEEQ